MAVFRHTWAVRVEFAYRSNAWPGLSQVGMLTLRLFCEAVLIAVSTYTVSAIRGHEGDAEWAFCRKWMRSLTGEHTGIQQCSELVTGTRRVSLVSFYGLSTDGLLTSKARVHSALLRYWSIYTQVIARSRMTRFRYVRSCMHGWLHVSIFWKQAFKLNQLDKTNTCCGVATTKS